MSKGIDNPGKGRMAEGLAMGNPPRVGEAPSKTNEQQPVPNSTSFGVKGLAFKRVSSGY